MDRRMDAIAGALDIALAGKPRAVIADFHEAACGHLGPIEAERDLVVAVARAGHAERQVIENAFVEAMHHAEPMRGREIDAGLPARGFEIYALVDGFLQHPSLPDVIGANLPPSPDEAKRNPGSNCAFAEVLGCRMRISHPVGRQSAESHVPVK